MQKPLTTLQSLIEQSPHSATSASVAAGLHKGTVSRWLAGTREPRLDELNRVLSVFGYELAAVKRPPVPQTAKRPSYGF